MTVIAACDVKVNSLCKIIDPKAESDPLVVLSLISKAAKASESVCTLDGKFWIRKKEGYSPNVIELILNRSSSISECLQVEAVYIPCEMEEQVSTLSLLVSDTKYYMDEIAEKLNVNDSSQIIVSRYGKTE